MLSTTPRAGLRLTTGLAQAIGLLSLTSAELAARVTLAAAELPALRLVPPPLSGGEGIRHHLPPLLDPEGLAAPEGSLIAHVTGQIRALRLSPRENAIALALTEGLEPTGWLGLATPPLARALSLPEEDILAVLARLQRIEPGGLFARSLAECLRLQAEIAGAHSPAMAVLLDNLPLLAEGGVAAVAAQSGLDAVDLAEAAGQIRSFDPKPGLAFSGPMPPAHPPDLLAIETPQGWLARSYAEGLKAEVAPGLPGATAARDLCRAIDRRRALAEGLGTLILRRQNIWLSGGELQPLTARMLADATAIHVATVNRALGAITIRTPRGTLPLRALTARPARIGGPPAAQIRQRLAALLAESPRPSDAALAARLTAEGMGIARRTVTKYRLSLITEGLALPA